jgi:hypothetical protein
MHWEAEQAYVQLSRRIAELEHQGGVSRDVRQWDKHGHLERMAASARFRWTREVVLHSVEEGNAQRLVGIALSQGGLAALLKAGISETEIGLDEFRAAAQRFLGDEPGPWWFSYRVRIGIR